MKEKEKQIREKIINALLTLLYEKELIRIRADEIASKAEVSKRTLYKYYETKTAMYLGVVERCFKDMNEYLKRSIEGSEKLLTLKHLEVMCRSYLNYMVTNPKQGKIIMFFNEGDYMKDYPKITRQIVLEANKYEPLKYFSTLSKQNQNPDFPPEGIAVHVHSTIFGLSLLLQTKRYWLEDYFGKSVDEIIEENIKILITLFGGNTDEKER